MAQEEKIIIDVEINVGDTEQKLGEVTKAISDLKAENKRLKDEIKSGTGDFAANNAMLKANEAEIKSLQVAEKDLVGMLTIADKQRRTYSDSIRGQAAQLSELKNQYMSLTKAERDSAAGKDMLKKLMELDKQVKENDASMGNFQRNVGNYPKVFDLSGTSIGKFSEILEGMGGTATTVGGVASTAFAGMKAQAISLGKAFLTPPIGLIVVVLSAIMFAVQKVVQAFKKNDEAATNLQQAMSALTPVTQGISWVFDKLAVILSKLAVGFGKVVGAILSIIPGYKKSADAANELVIAQDNLEETERQYVVNSAKRNAEIAKIKKQSVQTDKYTANERLAMLKRAEDLEKQNLAESKAIAKEKARIAIELAKQQVDTSDDTMDRLAQAQADMSKADEAYYTGTMRLESRATAARKENSKQMVAAVEEVISAEQRAVDALKSLESVVTTEFQKLVATNIEGFNKESLQGIIAIDKEKEEERLRILLEGAENRKQVLENEFEATRLKLMEAFASDVEFANAEYEFAKAEADRLTTLDSETKSLLYKNDADYTSAVIASKQEIAAASAQVAEAEQRQLEMQLATMQAFGTAMSDVLTEIAGDSKAALVFQKFIALANVSLNLAQAISAATAASTKGDPYTMAIRIATNVASVIVAFSQVVKSIKATNVPNAPKFATGGIVGGSSYTGDNVIARVNSGEMILNFEQQKKLFDMLAMNNNDSRGMIDYDLLARAMSRQPAPVMIYKEFTDFQEKIVTFDEHIKL
jgi:hypothetical protein